MGMLNFSYRAAVENGEPKEQLAARIAETLRKNNYDVTEQGGDITVKGLKAYFNSGSAVIKVDDKGVSVEGKTLPSVPGWICIAISVLLDLKGATTSCKIEDVLVVVTVIALGMAGTIGSIITFFFGKELMRRELALMIARAEK